jgi:N6-L-threonylcarbamoyladenine synthase
MNILGIETSCDETSAAVLRDGMLLSNVISSQVIHSAYGGIVPELASREHQKLIVPVIDEALRKAGISRTDLYGVAATYGPGLVGSLLIGLNFAKALAFGLGIPFAGVNHLEAHLYSNFLDTRDGERPEYPFICLVVSGGHTQVLLVRAPFDHTLLGQTDDDAAGEAYDKVAKMLGLGYPGGPLIDALAAEGDRNFIRFPRPLIHEDNFQFSFSGLKTAVLYYLRDANLTGGETLKKDRVLLANICASFQSAVVDVLVSKTLRAARQWSVHDVAVAGGVSANTGLRNTMQLKCKELGLRLHIPKMEFCTDNGAMVAMVGWMKITRGMTSPLDLTAVAHIEY